ncbi:MAG: hypothetical protein WA156_16010 [Methylocystis silviterrae]
MTETALERAKRKFEQAKAALDAIKARESAAERKKDTRRKIVIGGALLELSRTNREASDLVTRLIASLSRDHDKKLFDKSVRKEAAPELGKVETPAVQPVAAPPSEPQKTRVLSPMPDYVTPPVRRYRDEI